MPGLSPKGFRCSVFFAGFLQYTGLLVLLLLFCPGSPGAGPKHPDLSGTWVLDEKRSDFGPLPAPSKIVDVLEQSDDELKIKRTLLKEEREANYQFIYRFDGREVIQKATFNSGKSRSHWEGSTLVVETDMQVKGLPLKIVDHWELESACECLVISRHFQNKQGEMNLRLTMIKQLGGLKK